MSEEIEFLKMQIQFAHDRIARLDTEAKVLRALVLGILRANPDKALLAEAIPVEKELYLSAATYSPIPDAAIADI